VAYFTRSFSWVDFRFFRSCFFMSRSRRPNEARAKLSDRSLDLSSATRSVATARGAAAPSHSAGRDSFCAELARAAEFCDNLYVRD